MSWQHQRMPQHAALLPMPDDGVAVSNHPPGWLGKRWRSLIDRSPRDARDRVLRGKNYARRGRLRLLDISPGSATGEVVCEDCFRPTVRVDPFSRNEWASIVRVLTSDLNLIASLLEGELSRDLVTRLEKRGVRLIPTADEVRYDCDCGDYVMPCAHVATVFHVLTDALDGDPFLLLTLRGRSRDHLLATLRSDWGDDAPLAAVGEADYETPPETSWFDSPQSLPDFSCHWGDEPVTGAGLRALGPPPGESDLLDTLMPLYEAGHEATRQLLDSLADRPSPRRRANQASLPFARGSAPDVVEGRALADDVAEVPDAVQPPPKAGTPPKTEPAPQLSFEDVDEDEHDEEGEIDQLTEQLVDALAEADGITSSQLAKLLGVTVSAIRAELVELLDLGLVYREQAGRGVKWFLG